MIYGNESISQYSRSNVIIWMSMAFQAGMLNMGGLAACHRFVSHVTGFATQVGSELNEPYFGQAVGMAIVPTFFLLGGMLSGLMVDLRLKTHRKPRYYITFGLIFALLLLVWAGGLLGWYGPFGVKAEQNNYALLILLCFTCGVQNGTITTVSRSVVRTTHLTGITTDLGIGIVRHFARPYLGQEIPEEGKANLMRIGIISFFILGGAISDIAYLHWGYGGFFLPVLTSGTLFFIMFYFQVLKSGRA